MEMALPKWKAAAPVATMESIILGTPPPQLWYTTANESVCTSSTMRRT